jgi:hypothetical protein
VRLPLAHAIGAGLSACSHTESRRTERKAAAEECRVTLPNGDAPRGERPSPRNDGNGKPWTVLPPGGVVRPTRGDTGGPIDTEFIDRGLLGGEVGTARLSFVVRVSRSASG